MKNALKESKEEAKKQRPIGSSWKRKSLNWRMPPNGWVGVVCKAMKHPSSSSQASCLRRWNVDKIWLTQWCGRGRSNCFRTWWRNSFFRVQWEKKDPTEKDVQGEKKDPTKKDDDGARTLVVIDSLHVALDYDSTTYPVLCALWQNLPIQILSKSYNVIKKRRQIHTTLLPFLEEDEGKLPGPDTDRYITVKQWDTSQPLPPEKRGKRGRNRESVDEVEEKERRI